MRMRVNERDEAKCRRRLSARQSAARVGPLVDVDVREYISWRDIRVVVLLQIAPGHEGVPRFGTVCERLEDPVEEVRWWDKGWV